MAALRFSPGDLFAGRYRMIACIGRGGMGEVWRVDDQVLQTPVALKVIDATIGDGRLRILNEVRLARQVTHPAVCRVFDVGQTGGELFYTMELVDGEDLATLLRRLGRLPVEKVRDIGLQLCGGLAAAHAQGVLHRDLKPANVLIDQNGAVRITDFGIAISRDDTGGATLIGTPAYMAPEQLVAGTQLSEQTDLFALGIVLYELLVGRLPFPDGPLAHHPPPRPSQLVADIDPQIERVVLQALASDPRARPASADEMAARLRGLPVKPRRPRVWLAGAAVALVVGLVAATASRLMPLRADRALTDQDTIVVADFTNTTGEPVFDGTLKVALAIALEQSPFLKVFPDERIQETLRLMQRPPETAVTRLVAREIARREQLKALVSGSIGSLGSHYVLALEALNAETGDVMAREQIEASSKEDVLASLGSATSRLREKLGESLASIQRFDVPLPRATTSSLEALHAYALALDEGRVLPRVEAIPHLKRALDLDPSFALAYAALSGVYVNTGQSAEAPAFSRKAFELRDQVSERERFLISWRYYRDAEQAWDKALDLSLSWTRTYPREAFAFNSLGIASGAFGRFDQAATALYEAVRLDPKFLTSRGNLAGVLMELGRTSEARAVIREARARGMESLGLRQIAYLVGLLENDETTMTSELDRLRGSSDAMWAPIFEARTAAVRGQITMAHALFERGSDAAVRSSFRELAAQWGIEDAEMHAIAGACEPSAREAAAGLALMRDNYSLERASRAAALCGNEAEASRLVNELAMRFPTATLTMRLHVPVTRAIIALHHHDPERALTLLAPVVAYDHAPAAEFWPSYVRGLAYLQRNDGPSAATEFQSIADHRGEAPTSALYGPAHLGLARAARLMGKNDAARAHYERLLALWSGADSTLPALVDARREFAGVR